MSGFDPSPGERVRDVHVTEHTLAVDLLDGRTVIVPLAWYPRLWTLPRTNVPTGTSAARDGIHRPELDEDLSTEGLLRGVPAAAESAHLRR